MTYAQKEQFSPGASTVPARASGAARLLSTVSKFSLQAGLLAAAVVATDAVLPSGLKISELFGRFEASIASTDARQKVDAQADYTRRIAEGQAQPPAFAQMESDANRVQQEILRDSMGVLSTTANGLDLACIAGQFMPRGGDWRDIGDTLRGTCGMSNQVRNGMLDTMRRSGQNGSTFVQRPTPNQGTGR